MEICLYTVQLDALASGSVLVHCTLYLAQFVVQLYCSYYCIHRASGETYYVNEVRADCGPSAWYVLCLTSWTCCANHQLTGESTYDPPTTAATYKTGAALLGQIRKACSLYRLMATDALRSN
eukprot:COSAG01_NODE_762_length_13792_cov_19.126707_15_plen_122_part_00